MNNRGAGLTGDQIVAIAKRNGYFRVTLRWRDDKLRAKCRRMVREGLLTGGRRIIHGGFYFYPVAEKQDENSGSSI